MNEKITKLPLEGKYLKYSPEITFDIFKLVWYKLISLGYLSQNSMSIEYRYDEFKGEYPYFRETTDIPLEFNCYARTVGFKETTVQEILGYNPFIKETTISKDWNEVTEEELLEEAKRRYPIGCKVKLVRYNIGGDFKNEVRFTKYMFCGNSKGKHLFVDGNLLLFNEGVWAEIESLPEVETKEVIPEYIECIKPQSVYFIPGNIYKVLNTKYINSCTIVSNIRCSLYEANNTLWVSLADTSYFKPSTKEAFDAQVEKEPVRLSFYVKYCDEFTEDLLKSLMEWSQKNNTLKNRGRDNSFKGLKNDGYFIFDNFGLASFKSTLYKDRSGYGYGVDNNKQSCLNEYSIKEVKELIGYKELTKSVEKWNVGSYIVPLQNKLLTRSEVLIKGKPYQIIKYTSLPYIISERGEEINFIDGDNTEKNEGIKWFATKSEAEEFAKTLVTPVKEEVKQAVHCKTQEEWDFVLSKLPKSCLLYKQNNKFEEYNNDYKHENGIAIHVEDCVYCGIGWCKNKGYQILSFQEWCDLSGYKMTNKKYKIEEIETNRKLIIYIASKEEHEKIQKVSKIVCDYGGNHCYSLYEGTYSSSSSESCPGAYKKDSIILTIDDINFEDNIENGDKEISPESYIGKYISFNYIKAFYDEAFIIKENGYIYVLNNCYSNNNTHTDKSKYKYSFRFDSIKEMLSVCRDIKFLDLKDIEFKPLTEDDLIWEIVEAPDKIKLIYLPEPN